VDRRTVGDAAVKTTAARWRGSIASLPRVAGGPCNRHRAADHRYDCQERNGPSGRAATVSVVVGHGAVGRYAANRSVPQWPDQVGSLGRLATGNRLRNQDTTLDTVTRDLSSWRGRRTRATMRRGGVGLGAARVYASDPPAARGSRRTGSKPVGRSTTGGWADPDLGAAYLRGTRSRLGPGDLRNLDAGVPIHGLGTRWCHT
jgi:hypothetical protein